MGIFDLFKKLVRENKVEETVIEKFAFSEIKNWIENKTKENEFKEKEIILVIKDKIKRYNNELNKKIKILEDFDLEAKKEKEDIKGIVRNSRKDYIKSVEDFLENLNNLEMNEFEESMKKINKIFFDFKRSSYKNYERATILIGKEMRSIKESLKVFSKEIIKTFDEGKDILNLSESIFFIKLKLNQITQTDEIFERVSEEIISLDKKINDKKEENKKLMEEIEKIKKSPNYLECLRTQKKIESLKEELKNDILGLKQLLDFKALANFYHSFEKEMNVIKEYKENFYKRFLKDNGKSIIILLDEAKLNNEIISEKIKKIHPKTEEIEKDKKWIREDETQELYPKIKEIVLEIDNLKIEKVKEEKRHEKLKISKEETIGALKQELGKMNVELI